MNETIFKNVGTKSRLVDRVVSEIQQQVVEGKLTPGMLLPPERELTEQLGVSRTALREAVRMLVTKGLLETRPGVGTIVKKITSQQITEPLTLLINQAGEINLDHLNQVRQILEVEIARVAARQATDEDIINIENMLARMEAVKHDPMEFNRRDAEFHMALAEASHNPLLAVLLNSIRDLIEQVRQLVQHYPHLSELVMPDHVQIYQDIKTRNPESAGQSMRFHLEHARKIQEEFLASQNTSDF